MKHGWIFRGILIAVAWHCAFALAQGRMDGSGYVVDQVAVHFEHVFGSPDNTKSQQPGTVLMPEDDRIGRFPGTQISQMEIRGTSAARADVKGSDSTVEVAWYEAGMGWTVPLAPGRSLGLVATAGSYAMNEKAEDPRAMVFGYDRLWQVDAGIVYTHNLSPRWDVFGGSALVLTGGSSSHFKDSASGLFFGGAVFRVNPNLSIAGGVTLATEDSRGQKSVPMVLIEWRINDVSRLMLKNGLVYEYAFGRDWDRVLGIGFEGDSWMAKLMEIPEAFSDRYNDGYISVMDVSMNLYYRHRFANGFAMTTKLGFFRAGEHSLYSGNRELASVEIGSSVGLGLGVGFRF